MSPISYGSRGLKCCEKVEDVLLLSLPAEWTNPPNAMGLCTFSWLLLTGFGEIRVGLWPRDIHEVDLRIIGRE